MIDFTLRNLKQVENIVAVIGMPMSFGSFCILLAHAIEHKTVRFHVRFLLSVLLMFYSQLVHIVYWWRYDVQQHATETYWELVMAEICYNNYYVTLIPVLLFTWQYFDTVSSIVPALTTRYIQIAFQIYMIVLTAAMLITVFIYDIFSASFIFYSSNEPDYDKA